jgi:hypothetical protein
MLVRDVTSSTLVQYQLPLFPLRARVLYGPADREGGFRFAVTAEVTMDGVVHSVEVLASSPEDEVAVLIDRAKLSLNQYLIELGTSKE